MNDVHYSFPRQLSHYLFQSPLRRLCKQPRAAWLPPYKLEVAPGIFVTLRDKAIRDPFDGATRVVTVRVNASA